MRFFPGWWQVVAALILQGVSSASVFTCYSVIANALQQEFQPSRMMLMMGITVAALAAGTLGAPLGAAVDRYSVRKLMLAGTAILSTGFLLISFTTSMSQVIALFFLVLAPGCVLIGPMACAALVARWFARRRGMAMSIAASGAAVGGLILPPLLQFLIASFEWRTGLAMFSGVLFLVTAPTAFFLVIDRPSVRNLFPDGDSEPPPAITHGHHQKTNTAFFLRDARFWIIASILGIMLSGPTALMSSLVPFVTGKGLSAAQGATLLSIFSAANFVGKLSCGAIADRVDLRLMLAILLLFLSLGALGYLQAGTFYALAATSIIFGLSQGTIVPLWSLLLAKVYGPDSMGRSMGLMGFLIMPFTLVAPPLFGWIFDRTGSYDKALWGYIIVTLCALALVAKLRMAQRAPVPAIAS